MKSAMQELWEYIEANYNEEGFNIFDAKEKSLELEKQQMIISDDEIEEMLFHHSNEYAYGFKDSIKWYREKLKVINDKTNR
jgi:hypothetical protein